MCAVALPLMIVSAAKWENWVRALSSPPASGYKREPWESSRPRGQQDHVGPEAEKTHPPCYSDNLHGPFSLCQRSPALPLPGWPGNLCLKDKHISVKVSLVPSYQFVEIIEQGSDLESWCSVYEGDHPVLQQHLGWCSRPLWRYPAAWQTDPAEVSA